MGQAYELPVARFLRQHVQPGATCFDVGANVGVYVLQLARWSAPAGRVIAFEPNPLAATVLEQHIQMNGLTDRVEIVQAAVGEQCGAGCFYRSEADGMSRLGAPNPALSTKIESIDVAIVSLDVFCDERKLEPDWIMIDVEGFELAVLAGARRLLGSHRPRIIVEMHPDGWEVAGRSRRDAVTLLNELAVTPLGLTGQQDPLAEYGHVLLAWS